MTLRLRRPKGGIRTSLGKMVEGEERQSAVLTWAFIATIVTVVVILIGAIAVSWYNDNLRPLARVGSVEVRPQQLRDALSLGAWRIGREEGRVTQAQISGEISAETAAARMSELDQRRQALASSGLNDLVDGIYQSQLATEEGIPVTDADVEQSLTDEVAGVEQRHAHVIAVEAEAADEEVGPTSAERRNALLKAEEALAELEGGAEFADVAREYSTDPSAPNGGDLGLHSVMAISDSELARALWDLEEGGTTEIVRGDDGIYRIGRVTEIVEAGEEPGLREDLFETVPEAAVRELLRYEVGADGIRDKVVNEALAATPEQARIAVIFVEGLPSDDGEDQEGEIDYSEIVFAPNDDLVEAPDLDENDPAWAAAETEAQNTFNELAAVTDDEILNTLFAQYATDLSDAPSAEDGGRAGFITRSLIPTAVGDALFDAEHAENDLIGPIKGDAGWYVLLFHERRESVEQRVQAVTDALAAPGADFNEVARELSDGPEAADGGEVGWLTRDQLSEDLADDVFSLEVGEVSEPLELGEGQYFVKLEEKATRPLDPDQIPTVRATAFDTWYTPKKEAAITGGIIVLAEAPPADEEELEPGTDQL